VASDPSVSFADEALSDGKKASPIYLDAKSIPSTSVSVESLFSQSGFIFNGRRLSTTPEHIEELMFLKINHSLWDLEFVAKHVVNAKDMDRPSTSSSSSSSDSESDLDEVFSIDDQ
jgi:hypothetical protein